MSKKTCVDQNKATPIRRTRVFSTCVQLAVHAKRCSLVFIGVAALWMVGCAPADKPGTPAGTAPEKSTARQALEGFTGKTAVDAGLRTKDKIKAVNETREEGFEEF